MYQTQLAIQLLCLCPCPGAEPPPPPPPTLLLHTPTRLQAQDINSAFEVALSTSDLHLVMFLCQEVTPEQLFDSEQCPLTQPVLLSLVQQLSVDLQDQLELKIR